MHTFTARVLVIALVAGLGSGCASTLSAKTPKFRERDLRPMNQDLAAWLDRLNAGPTVAVTPNRPLPVPVPHEAGGIVPREPSVNSLPASQNLTRLAESADAVKGSAHSSTPLSNAAPSPAASTSTATAIPTPTALVAAVAAGATSPLSAASASTAGGSHPLGASQSPASPTLTVELPTRTLAAASEPKSALAQGSVIVDPVASVATNPITIAPLAPPKPIWTAFNGTSLREAVEEWSKTANWTVVWDAGIDYPIVGSLKYEGTYIDAVRGIFLAHAGAEKPLRADVYTRQQLIHITE